MFGSAIATGWCVWHGQSLSTAAAVTLLATIMAVVRSNSLFYHFAFKCNNVRLGVLHAVCQCHYLKMHVLAFLACAQQLCVTSLLPVCNQ